MEMDKELFDTLLQAMIDMKNAIDKQSKEMRDQSVEVNQKLDNIKDDIEDIKADIKITTGTLEKQDRRIKRLERKEIQ